MRADNYDEIEGRESSVHDRLLSKEEIIEDKLRVLSQDFLYVGIRKSDSSVDSKDAQKWLEPTSMENIGIFASYLSVGFGLYFIQAPLQYYMVNDLDASPAQQSVVMGLLNLPFALKLFCGFLSDANPIYGKRRKPYFCIGWFVFIMSYVILAILQEPTIVELAIFIFSGGMGFIQADVCTDAMIVERSKKYETGIFLVNAFLPLCVISPFFYNLVEVPADDVVSVRAQLQSIWELVQRRAIGMGAIQYEIILAMGAYGVIQFVVGIQFLPACRMFIGMCPEGSEGASYAMLTTLSNVSAVLAYSIASVMATVFDVSSEQLSNHNYSGMWKLTLLCGCIQFTGLFFLPLLPTGLKEQIIRQENDESSPIAGAIFVFVVGSCLLFILTYTAITVAT
eukprot:gene27093-35808_t